MPIIDNVLEHKAELSHTIIQMLSAIEVVTKAEAEPAHYIVKGYYIGNLIRVDIRRKHAEV